MRQAIVDLALVIMKKILQPLIALLLLVPGCLITGNAHGKDIPAGDAAAGDSAASDASISELLELTNARQLVAGMKAPVDAMMNDAMRDALKGKTVTPEVQAIIDRSMAKMCDVINDTLSWDALLPIYQRTYRDSFSEEELAGVIAFYKSPAGQAVVKKMPLVLQNLLGAMQVLEKAMHQKVEDIVRDTLKELEELQDSHRTHGASTS
jgi:uncharacterized protein